jgi:hypothetical protein
MKRNREKEEDSELAKRRNLNLTRIKREPNGYKIPNNTLKKDNVSCIFKNLENELVTMIKGSDAVIGCIAWLTNPVILEALSTIPTSIVVQKEDFLRPDSEEIYSEQWKEKLHEQYMNVKTFKWEQGDSIEGIDIIYNRWSAVCHWHDKVAIRCAGHFNSEKKTAFPRMHHKFLVFLKKDSVAIHSEITYTKYIPTAVWTGSFNFTVNSTNSLENAVIIRDEDITRQYSHEWYDLIGISEALDWKSDWSKSELRDGS